MKISKDWYKSKTMVAGIALMVIALNKQFGIEIPETEIFAMLEIGTNLALGLIVLYGRVTASTKLK